MLAHKYKLLAKLNQGSFGQIYKAENIRTGELVAVKIEPKNGDQKSLKSEAKIYQYLAKLDGFPQLKWYGSTDKVTYLVTDLLDYSIYDLVGVFLQPADSKDYFKKSIKNDPIFKNIYKKWGHHCSVFIDLMEGTIWQILLQQHLHNLPLMRLLLVELHL